MSEDERTSIIAELKELMRTGLKIHACGVESLDKLETETLKVILKTSKSLKYKEQNQ